MKRATSVAKELTLYNFHVSKINIPCRKSKLSIFRKSKGFIH